MRFFNIDLHIGVISDIKKRLAASGHAVDDWTLSAHAWVLGRERDPVKVINHLNWRTIDEELAWQFYQEYKDTLDKYDAFIVTHTPCFAQLFEKWNKPIIVVASTRYEHPYTSDASKWKNFNHFLTKNIDSGKIIPVSNNKYDAFYAEYFTNRKWQVISSICDYTGCTYAPVEERGLLFAKKPLGSFPYLVDKNRLKPGLLARIAQRLGVPNIRSGFSWAELGRFLSAVHIPYNLSVMSIFEHYYSNIPLFFPSEDFAMTLYNEEIGGIFSEISFNQVLGLPEGSDIVQGEGDPNCYRDFDTLRRRLPMADFYDAANLAHIQYFSSFEELKYMHRQSDFKKISAMMGIHNRERVFEANKKWEQLVKGIAS